VNHSRHLLLLTTLVLLAYGGAGPALAQVKPAAPTAIVDAAVKDLQSGAADVQQGAEVRLYALPPEEFPMLEAAAKRADLKPGTAARLKVIVDAVRPLVGRRIRAARARASVDQWTARIALTSYDSIGKRNPKWDDAARAGLARAYEKGVEPLEMYEALDKATQLGCDDPLVLAIKAYVSSEMNLADQEILARDLTTAADAIVKSGYPAPLVLPAVVRAGLHPGRQVYKLVEGKLVQDQADPRPGRLLPVAMRLWPEVLKSAEIPDSLLLKRADELVELGSKVDGASKPTFDKVLAAMEAAPTRGPVSLLFKGNYYTVYAWDARGRGFANTVTPEGARLMQERLEVASAALMKAYDLNPNDAAAATAMMGVELGQGKGKDVLEMWFARAMKADPDNYQACANKLYYLEPKWYGSMEEMLAFGRECRDSKNWYGRLPMVLVNAHDQLSRYAPKPDQYFQLPGVWADIQSVYQPILNAWPENALTRSKFAYYACQCGQWAEAKRQFDRLGDKAEAKAFGDDSKMEDMKEKAMNGGR
jgi:tetratricopeptide (TPR) repeat protein